MTHTDIVLIYADTGGGHRATAQAVAAGLQRIGGAGVRTELVNATPYMPYPYNVAERAYPAAIAHARTGYAAFWHLTNNKPYAAFTRVSMQISGRRAILRFFAEHPADVYVSCHPLVNQMLPQTAQRLHPNAPFVAVVSDMVTIHSLFWSDHITRVLVPTNEARALAIRRGMRPDRVITTGQPVLPDFAARAARGRAMRKVLGLDERMFTVLLMGGGDGMGRLEVTARELALSGLPIQMLVVCGRNRTVRENLEFVNPRVPYMKIFGFVDNVPELMGASDLIITKAGPGTICEAFIAGLPIMLYDAVPGQEEGNVHYVVEKGAGAWCPTPAAVLKQLRTWIAQPADLAAARRSSLSLARPDSAIEIARIVGRFLP